MMGDEYDFSNCERGKFFSPDATLVPPVHLDPDILRYLSACATAQVTSLSALVNRLSKMDIDLIEAID